MGPLAQTYLLLLKAISRVVVYLNVDKRPTAETPEIYGGSDQSYSRLL